MNKRFAAYLIVALISTILIGLILYTYRDYKKMQKLNLKSSTRRIVEKNKLAKIEETKGNFGYSDILSFSSSNDGMKITSIENSEGERSNTKVNFQYVGNNMEFQCILDKLLKQNNLISVNSIKITHNKDNESILGTINATFIKNK